MALILPVDSTGDRRIQVLLGANLVTLRTYWNPIVPGWYMDLVGADGQNIILGVAMVPEINLLAFDLTLTRLYGQFRVFTLDISENNTPDSLGSTAQLWWFSSGEWERMESQVRQNPQFPFDVREMYRAGA